MKRSKMIKRMADLFISNNTLDILADDAGLIRCEIEEVCDILLEEIEEAGMLPPDRNIDNYSSHFLDDFSWEPEND